MIDISRFVLSSLAIGMAFGASGAGACEFRYATKLAEVSGEAKLEIASDTLKEVTSQLESGLGDSTSSRQVKIGAGYSISAAGGLAQSAYSETVNSFFQCLKEAYASDPAKQNLLEDRRKELTLTLDAYFDVGRWLPDNVQERDDMREELQTQESRQAPFALADIDSKLPNPNFDTISTVSFYGDLDLLDIDLGACGGFVKRSIRKVDSSVLSSLPLIRATILNYLTGDDVGAKIDLWLFASEQMRRQMSQSLVEERVRVTPATISCLQEQSAAIEAQLQEIAADVPDAAPMPSTSS